jgi:hypothetical protein
MDSYKQSSGINPWTRSRFAGRGNPFQVSAELIPILQELIATKPGFSSHKDLQDCP